MGPGVQRARDRGIERLEERVQADPRHRATVAVTCPPSAVVYARERLERGDTARLRRKGGRVIRRRTIGLGSLAGVVASVLGCGDAPPDPASFAVPEVGSEPVAAACAHRDERKMALWGDLHVHTMLSSDAWNYDLQVRPEGAYRYAFGGEILLPPNDENGRGTRTAKIDRPLDFAAVTDHAEFLGEQRLCTDEISPAYYTDMCQAIRDATQPTDSPLGFKIMHPFPSREAEICGEDGRRCEVAAAKGWAETIAAAEKWNDTSAACERTTFIAYEYSSHRLGSNLHRNVIFRGSAVPWRPISYMETQREWELWSLLDDQCNDSGTGCEAIAIPHNSNISNGRMFNIDYPGAGSVEAQAARAALRIKIEPIVEIMQHKGDSECRRGVPGVLGVDDALCDFEKFEDSAFRYRNGDEPARACYDGFLQDAIPHLGPNCLSRRSYVRYALVDGLAEEARLGVNPFKFGLMASTDTHNAMAGGVEERSWPGHLGIADGSKEARLRSGDAGMGNYSNGPGGLIGVWAEENSRDAIFDAMQRKEVFGTSGPRIEPRFYGGWGLQPGLCGGADVVGDVLGRGGLAVPMGGDLPPRIGDAGPTFAVFASRDPGTPQAPGGRLQRLQIVKGWVDDDGTVHERVVDVAGGPNDADVDPATCAPRGRQVESARSMFEPKSVTTWSWSLR
ncbi:MAG: DUF3604 domain-containing protein [Myxococcota bacterium]